MSIVLAMVAKNQPLSTWQSFVDSGQQGMGFHPHGKNGEKIAQAIFSGLSHPAAVELVAREFGLLPEQIRLQLRTLAAAGNSSKNVRKNLQRLNELLGGKFLSEERQHPTFARRVDGIGGPVFQHRAVNPAIAGATRKYGILDGGKKKKGRR